MCSKGHSERTIRFVRIVCDILKRIQPHLTVKRVTLRGRCAQRNKVCVHQKCGANRYIFERGTQIHILLIKCLNSNHIFLRWLLKFVFFTGGGGGNLLHNPCNVVGFSITVNLVFAYDQT